MAIRVALALALFVILLPFPAGAPPVVAAVGAAALSYATGATIFGLSVGLSAAIVGVASLAMGFITAALTPKPKGGDFSMPDFSAQASDRNVMVRQAITSGKIQFGRLRLSGVQSFVERTGGDNGTMHVLVTLSINKLSRLDELWFNDEQVPLDWAFGDGVGGNATGKYAGKVRAWFGDGTVSGDAALNAALTAAVLSQWTPDHKQTGCGKIYVQMDWDSDLFASGAPNISAVCRCSPEIYDPRTASTAWTDNAALVLARYLTIPEIWGGFGAPYAQVDESTLIAAANACDEMVTLAAKGVTFTADASANTIALANGNLALTTGANVRVSTTGGLPGGLAAATDYWFINLGSNVGKLATSLENAKAGTAIDITSAGTGTHTLSISTTFTADATANELTLGDSSQRLRTGTRLTVSSSGTLPAGLAAATNYYFVETGTKKGGLATSLANARARTLIDITDAGTGTHTITSNAEPRYTANGTVDTDDLPRSIIPRMLSAMAGKWVRRGGKFYIYAGVWTGPTISAFSEDDVADKLTVAWRREPRDLFNGVKGTYTDPESAWQPTDFPAVSVSTYLSEDQSVRSWKDADLPYTISPTMAQRIARIDLETIRRQISFAPRLKLKAIKVAPGDVIPFDWARYGWTGGAKTFEVKNFRFMIDDKDGAPGVAVELQLSEIDANVYAWTPSADEQVTTPSPRTNLPSAATVAPPTSLVLTSGTTELDVRIDGTIFSRIRATWTAPADAFVKSGGLIEIQYKKSAAGTWGPSEFTAGDATTYTILDVEDGVAYDVRIRARNYLGTNSPGWVTQTNHVVVGKTAPPADVASLSAAANGTAVVLQWTSISDADLDGYDIRYSPQTSNAWSAATPLSEATGATSVTSVAVPPGSWRFYIKAKDTSGNFSTNAASAICTIGTVGVSGTNVVVASSAQAPDWLGTKTNCHVHYTGALVPDSTVLAKDMTDAELWDEFNAYPVSDATYEAPEIDLGFDAPVRTYATLAGSLGYGESVGAFVATLEYDYKLAAGSYGGFLPWSIGTNTLRYLKQRITLKAANGKAICRTFTPTIDSQVRADEGGTNVSVGAGGQAITFGRRFFNVPNIQVTPTGVAVQQAWAESPTTSGFTLKTANGAGTATAGNANWIATGV